MKATILQENLARALSIVGRAVKSNSTLPVLANVLVSAENGKLRFAATNLEIGITCLVDAVKIEQEGAVTIPAKTFSDLVGTLTKEEIGLTLDAATQTLTVKSGRSKTNIKGIAAAEFPAMPKPIAAGIELPAAEFKEAILKVAPASSEDESRPTLTGIHLHMAANKATLEAADGFRMSQSHLTVEYAGPAVQAIIPAAALEELARVATGGSLAFFLNSNQVIFRLGEVEIAAQLIEGQYPDLGQIVPRSFKTRTVVPLAAFQKAVKQADIFARQGRQIITLDITPANGAPGACKVSGESEETGRSETAVEAAATGNAIKIAFNPRYLNEALKTIKSANVALETNTDATPGVIRPEGDDTFFHLLMPMHLS